MAVQTYTLRSVPYTFREYIHNPAPIQSNKKPFTDYLSVNMPILAKNEIKRFF